MNEVYEIAVNDTIIKIWRDEEYKIIKSTYNEIWGKMDYHIDFEQRQITFKCIYSSPIHITCFLLDRNCKIVDCENNVMKILHYNRIRDVVKIESKYEFSHIKLIYKYNDSKMNSEYLINACSGILVDVIYPNIKKTVNIFTVQKNNIFCSKRSADSLNDLYCYYNSVPDFYCVIGNGNINFKIDKYGYNFVYFKKMIEDFSIFYQEIFNSKIDVSIVDSSVISSQALSLEKLILVKRELCEKQNSFLHRYLIHELVHQEVGIKVKFIGYGGEWLKESLTEYIQFLFFERFFKKDFSKGILKYYKKLYFAYRDFDILSVCETYTGMPVEQFNAVIGAKGFFILRTLWTYFDDDEITIIKKIYEIFSERQVRYTIQDFFLIAEKISGKKLRRFYDDWICKKGIPRIRVKWKYMNNEIRIRIVQLNKKKYDIKVNIEFMFKKYRKNELFHLYRSREEFKISAKEKPIDIVVEPGNKVLLEYVIQEVKDVKI